MPATARRHKALQNRGSDVPSQLPPIGRPIRLGTRRPHPFPAFPVPRPSGRGSLGAHCKLDEPTLDLLKFPGPAWNQIPKARRPGTGKSLRGIDGARRMIH